MLRLIDLHKSFPDKVLFDNLSWNIHPGERYGLIGANGIGKTSLLRIISGQDEPDKGRVLREPYVRTGYLAQAHVADSDATVREELAKAFGQLHELDARIHEVERHLETLEAGEAFDEAFLVYSDLTQRREWLDPYTVEARIGKVAAGLGFTQADLSRPVLSFSGGWRVRMALGKLLLEAPNVLLLDEPTNHLDLEAINWLEGYLQTYPGAVILVSHDRHFLDAVITKVVSFTPTALTEFTGSYSHFREAQKEQRESLLDAKARQDKELARQQVFIERFRASATKSTQAKSREKLIAKVERIEVPPEDATIGFKFPPPPESAEVVARLVKLVKKYGDRTIISHADPIEIRRGARIGLLGRNGAGKTTLLKLMAGVESPTSGRIEFGYNVLPGYYAQDQADSLNELKTVWEEAYSASRRLTDQQLRDLLARFLFRGDAIQKPVSVLSGGERARLALCKLLLSPVNLLLMDEPTNHLDLASKEVLVEALRAFPGTVVLISHDRHFLESVCQQSWIVGDGQLTPSDKGVAEWLSGKNLPPAAAEVPVPAVAKVVEAPVAAPAPRRGVSKKEVDKLLTKIEATERALNLLADQMNDPELYKDADKAKAVGTAHKALQAELEAQFDKLTELESLR